MSASVLTVQNLMMVTMGFKGKNQGKASKADTMVGACYRPPNQDEEADEIFYKQPRSLTIAGPCSHGGLQLTRCLLEIKYSRQETSLGGSWSVWKLNS